MRLTTVGVSGSLPGPWSPASCHLVEVPDPHDAGKTWRVVLDLGNGSLGALQRVADPGALDAVLLSHLHPDHCLDVAPLAVLLRFDPRGAGATRDRLPVWGPTGVAERLARAYDPDPVRVPADDPDGHFPGAGEPLTDLMAFHEWRDRQPVAIGPLTVTPIRVHHPVEAYGFRVSGPGPGGSLVTLSYSGDTGPGPGLDAVAEGTDLFLCEAGFTVAQAGQQVTDGGLHCSGRDAGEAAARGRVGRLVLTHVPPWNIRAEADSSAREAFAGPVDLAAPGQTWVVGEDPALPSFADRLDVEHRRAVEESGPVDLSDLAAVRAARTAGLAAVRPVPDPAAVRSDHDAGGVLVRVHRPVAAAGPLPVLLWLHGGGFVMGGLAEDDAQSDHLAVRVGCAVASVDYRLAPEHPYPAALDDALTALEWLATAGSDLGLDLSRVAVGGYSAGGGLAAALALRARGGPVRPSFQLLLAPMLDDRDRPRSAPTDRRVWHPDVNRRAWQAYVGDDAGRPGVPPTAAPARARPGDLAGLPPAYLAVGDLDLFLDETLGHAAALDAAGVPVDVRVYPGAFHGSAGRLPDAALSRRWREDRDEAVSRAFSRAAARP